MRINTLKGGNKMSGFYPYNPGLGQVLQSDVEGAQLDRGFIAHFQVTAANAVAPNTTGVHAAVTDNSAQQVVTTAITNPAVPRNITATAGGTAADIKPIQVIIAGTNYNDEAITETLPAFTENTAGSVTGSKAFKTVTSITIPAHDGNGATTAIGWGDKYGLPYKRAHIPCLGSYLNNVLEATAATMTASATAMESNTIDLNSASNGNIIDSYLVV
jgi:hypothetical protein